MIKSILVAAMLAGVTSPAFAQSSLDQNATGIVRGIESQNTSGQVGEVRYRSNAVEVAMNGTDSKSEAVTINRGFECSDQPGTIVARLGRLSNGKLAAAVSLTSDRLLSGNYLVVVHNNDANSRAVACGQLYK